MARVDTSSKKINGFLARGVVTAITRPSIIKKLSSGRVLRVKHGVDPSGSELHLGHAVIYLKLRELQEMGHRIVFLIGGFTGRFGDPTAELQTRTLKSKKETELTAQDYIRQIGKILDITNLEIRTNSEWYDNLPAEDLLHLMSNFTVDQTMERDMFRERKKQGRAVQLHELVYPVLQGYDSVRLKSDLTVIGTDQIFNENFGRILQRKLGQNPQDIIALPMLTGLDGTRKMSKSLNNYIAIRETANEQFGKIMSLPDSLIIDYFLLTTRRPLPEVKAMAAGLKNKSASPLDLKLELAKEIVTYYHSPAEAQKASNYFLKTFSKKQLPRQLPRVRLAQNRIGLLALVSQTGLVRSKSDARRLIAAGAVEVNAKKICDPNMTINIGSGLVLKIGKHRFVKIIPAQ